MKKDQIYRKRLLVLADFLKTVPKKRFDFKHWVGLDWAGDPKLTCGTTACALGWATTIPMFKRLGMYLGKAENYVEVGICLKGIGVDEDHFEEIGMKIFGLRNEEMHLLFVPRMMGGNESSLGSDATAKDVARHIRKFVKVRYPEDKKKAAKPKPAANKD
jgi:hypothetical protein